MRERVFLDGKFLPVDEARVSVLEPGFLYGFGLFETMRSYNKKIVYLDEHLHRLKDSCRITGIKFSYSFAELKGIIKKATELSGSSDTYLRLTLWKAAKVTKILLIARQYKPHPAQKYKNGFKVCVSVFRQNENSLLARIKSTSRLFYELTYQQAKAGGFDEAIILNSRGNICEGTRSNIFLVKDNALFTPLLECACLAGITRKAVIDLAKKHNLKTYAGRFTMRDFYAADEVFLTNSLMGIMPVNKCAALTSFLIKKYNCLLR